MKNNISKRNNSRKNTTDEQQTKKESTSEKSGEREDGFEGEREEEPLVLCSRIPDEDDDFNEANHHQIQKEETTFRKDEEKRRRRITVERTNRTRHECDVCEKVFRYPSILADTCVLTRTRNRTSAMCARKRFRQSSSLKRPHAYSHERETV